MTDLEITQLIGLLVGCYHSQPVTEIVLLEVLLCEIFKVPLTIWRKWFRYNTSFENLLIRKQKKKADKNFEKVTLAVICRVHSNLIKPNRKTVKLNSTVNSFQDIKNTLQPLFTSNLARLLWDGWEWYEELPNCNAMCIIPPYTPLPTKEQDPVVRILCRNISGKMASPIVTGSFH